MGAKKIIDAGISRSADECYKKAYRKMAKKPSDSNAKSDAERKKFKESEAYNAR